jgi:O-antigen ligase
MMTLTLLGLLLGGSTLLWEQAVLVLLAAALLLLAPPRYSLGWLPNLLFIALFVLSLSAFLPAGGSAPPPWRQALLSDPRIILPSTRTPQPWLTAQACCLLFAGLVWAYYILSQGWDSGRRLLAARVLVLGVALLSALALAAFAFDFHVPFWDQEENRGWFPNRNQTADVLAICGVVNYGLVFYSLRKERLAGFLWLTTLILIFGGLVVSYSRAGLLMFFGGIALWHLWPVQRRKVAARSPKWTVLGVSLVLVLLTLFLLFGGDTLNRFQGDALRRQAETSDFRLAVQEDAARFSLQSPWLGVGLGNFDALFASARQASVNEIRTIHPESDWLWAACELGWLAPLIFVAGIFWWLRRCLPFRFRPGESLRRAFTVAGILFILHGFVDVSAHRLGSFLVGFFVLSLALPAAVAPKRWHAGKPVFRAFGLVLLVIGAWWLASLGNAPVPPTSADLARFATQADDAIAHGDVATLGQVSNAALKIAPVSWHLYYQRAYAEAFQPGQLAKAGLDFMVARKLESKWVKPCFDEGSTWLSANQPDLCMDAWTEALHRATPQEEPDLYRQMVALSSSNDLVHADLLDLAAGRIDDELIYLDWASDDQTKSIITHILAADPDLQKLDPSQRQKLFTHWWAQGDRGDLIARLHAHPDWLNVGWIFLAQADRDQKDFQGAWDFVRRYAAAPIMPQVNSTSSIADLTHAFYGDSDNAAAGVLLYFAQLRAGQTDDALATLRAVEKLKDCPAYVYYLESQLWAARRQWELAFAAWWNFYQADLRARDN